MPLSSPLRSPRAFRAGLFFSIALAAVAAQGVFAQAVYTASVVIDGRHIALNPPAQLREGSVFVPVRGVFEHLGASVVFSGGRITAHGSHGETIVMHVGQTSATVNGQLVVLDNPPFIEGATTFVPLRFVSTALGAQVNFDNRTRTVYIQPRAVSTPAPVPPPPVLTPSPYPTRTGPSVSRTFRLQNQQPGPGSNVRTANPAISADFSEAADPNSVRVTIDGRDVTNSSFIGTNRFTVTPSFDLPTGDRNVSVSGMTATGYSFSQNWSFTVRPDTNVTRNYIQVRSPGPGSSVGSTFQFAGRTLPLSNVTVAASVARAPGDYGMVGPSFTRNTVADPFGNFSVDISVPNAGPFVRVFVQSTSRDGASAETTQTFPVSQ